MSNAEISYCKRTSVQRDEGGMLQYHDYNTFLSWHPEILEDYDRVVEEPPSAAMVAEQPPPPPVKLSQPVAVIDPNKRPKMEFSFNPAKPNVQLEETATVVNKRAVIKELLAKRSVRETTTDTDDAMIVQLKQERSMSDVEHNVEGFGWTVPDGDKYRRRRKNAQQAMQQANEEFASQHDVVDELQPSVSNEQLQQHGNLSPVPYNQQHDSVVDLHQQQSREYHHVQPPTEQQHHAAPTQRIENAVDQYIQQQQDTHWRPHRARNSMRSQFVPAELPGQSVTTDYDLNQQLHQMDMELDDGRLALNMQQLTRHSSRGTALDQQQMPPATSSFNVDVDGELTVVMPQPQDFVRTEALTCILCQRRLPSVDALQVHISESAMHMERYTAFVASLQEFHQHQAAEIFERQVGGVGAVRRTLQQEYANMSRRTQSAMQLRQQPSVTDIDDPMKHGEDLLRKMGWQGHGTDNLGKVVETAELQRGKGLGYDQRTRSNGWQ